MIPFQCFLLYYSKIKNGKTSASRCFLRLAFVICSCSIWASIPAGIYLFKVNLGNTRATCKIFSKLTKKIPKTLKRYFEFTSFKKEVNIIKLREIHRKLLRHPHNIYVKRMNFFWRIVNFCQKQPPEVFCKFNLLPGHPFQFNS